MQRAASSRPSPKARRARGRQRPRLPPSFLPFQKKAPPPTSTGDARQERRGVERERAARWGVRCLAQMAARGVHGVDISPRAAICAGAHTYKTITRRYLAGQRR